LFRGFPISVTKRTSSEKTKEYITMMRMSCLLLCFVITMAGKLALVSGGSGGEIFFSFSASQKISSMKNAIEGTRRVVSQKMSEVDRKVQDIPATSLNSDKVESCDESRQNVWGVTLPVDYVKSGEKDFIQK